MKLSESLKKWETLGLNEKTEVCKLHLSELIIAKGDHEYGITAAYNDILEGNKSRTPDVPIQVCWLREENKFLITDGLHRLTQFLLEGKLEYLCEIDWTGYTFACGVPAPNNRFMLKEMKTIYATKHFT